MCIHETPEHVGCIACAEEKIAELEAKVAILLEALEYASKQLRLAYVGIYDSPVKSLPKMIEDAIAKAKED